MIYRKKLYIVIVLLLIIFASVMLAFIMRKDTGSQHEGTLVREYCLAERI